MENSGYCLTSFQRKLLLKSLQSEIRSEYRRRIEIMLLADAGQSQSQICEALKCSQETARYWIGMAHSGQAHLWMDRSMGRPKLANDQYLNRLKELINCSPRECGYPFQRWTTRWLSQHLAKELGIEISDRHVGRLLREMGLSTRQAPNSMQRIEAQGTDDANITIRDLKSPSQSSVLWQLNLLKLTSNR